MKDEHARGAPMTDAHEDKHFEGKLAAELKQADPADIAEFIAASLRELRKLAVTFRMRFLVYLLEMAYQEADIQAADPPRKGPRAPGLR